MDENTFRKRIFNVIAWYEDTNDLDDAIQGLKNIIEEYEKEKQKCECEKK